MTIPTTSSTPNLGLPHPHRVEQFWVALADELDLPQSAYERAAARHKAVGEWLCRPESALVRFEPSVRPQGSFRYGTVVRPIISGAEYDLDHVVVLQQMTAGHMTQQELKALFGLEIERYAQSHGMQWPEQKNRCWRLRYRDHDLPFHLDSLPCIPAGDAWYAGAAARGVDRYFATGAVAITDRTHPHFYSLTDEWYTSNPRGFARWFESRAALGRAATPVQAARAEVEHIPTYAWKTPLQRVIQILKRHRDVMFRTEPDLAPISMILTNLAARAYEGERDVTAALIGVVSRMGQFVGRNSYGPRVPNPTHPDEDYADKWRSNPRLEQNFWTWLDAVKRDVQRLSAEFDRITKHDVERTFCIAVPESMSRLLMTSSAGTVVTGLAAPAVTRIAAAPKPWGST